MTRHDEDRFDQDFRQWASRPPDTLPEEAARRVLARLSEGPIRGWVWQRPIRLASATVGLILILMVGWLSGPRRSQVPSATDGGINLPPLPDDVVLLWLDDETPLYLTVAPPATKGDS